jgi:hypothetical protein
MRICECMQSVPYKAKGMRALQGSKKIPCKSATICPVIMFKNADVMTRDQHRSRRHFATRL